MKDSKVLVLVLGLATAVLLLTRFTAWPEMIAWPYLTLNGSLPYESIAVAHTPLLIFLLTGFYAIFGVGVVQLKIATWLLFFTTVFLLWKVAKEMWSEKVALWAVALYLPLFLIFEGNGLWFDHALAPIALLLYWLLTKRRFFWAGVTFALGVFTKQTFVWFSLAVVFYFFAKKLKDKSFAIMVFGGLLSTIFVLAVLQLLGLLPSFYFWTVVFGVFYLPTAAGQISFPAMRQLVFAGLPLTAAFFSPELIPWVIAGSLGVFPRWELFHFQPALPFVALALAALVAQKSRAKLAYFYFAVILVFFVRFLVINFNSSVRFYESEVVQVAEHVQEIASPQEKIYVANYWDSVYAYSGTMPAINPLVPYLSWYLSFPNVEQLMTKQLVGERPAIIVQGKYGAGLFSYKRTMVVEFIERNYEVVKEFENVEILKLKEK